MGETTAEQACWLLITRTAFFLKMGFSLLFSEGRTLSKVGLNIFLEDHNHGQSFNLSPGVVREPVWYAQPCCIRSQRGSCLVHIYFEAGIVKGRDIELILLRDLCLVTAYQCKK